MLYRFRSTNIFATVVWKVSAFEIQVSFTGYRIQINGNFFEGLIEGKDVVI